MDQNSEKNSNGLPQSATVTEQSNAPTTEDKIEKLKIILDNPKNTYFSGQTIRGTVSINCGQRTKIRGEYK